MPTILIGNITRPINWSLFQQELNTTYPGAATRAFTGNPGFVEVNHANVTQQNLQALIDSHDETGVSLQESISNAKQGLKDKAALAQDNAASIALLYNAVLDNTLNQVTQPDRFDALYAVVLALPSTFRNRLITDIEQELGFTVSASLTAAQQRQASLYIRLWVMPLVTLLTIL